MTDQIDYPSLIDAAMRDVVRAAIEIAADEGMPGNHHYYVSFRTTYPGVQISEALHARYPEEMTIVMQHQYWDLFVGDETFSIMLSFNNVPEKLVIPFDAITAFADPSVKFGLQFHVEPMAPTAPPAANSDDDTESSGKTKIDGMGKVITLDQFRKK